MSRLFSSLGEVCQNIGELCEELQELHVITIIFFTLLYASYRDRRL